MAGFARSSVRLPSRELGEPPREREHSVHPNYVRAAAPFRSDPTPLANPTGNTWRHRARSSAAAEMLRPRTTIVEPNPREAASTARAIGVRVSIHACIH